MRVIFAVPIEIEKILEKRRIAAVQNWIFNNFLHSIKFISWTRNFEINTEIYLDQKNSSTDSLAPVSLKITDKWSRFCCFTEYYEK